MKYRLHSALMIAHGKFVRNLARSSQEVGLYHGQPKVLECISNQEVCTQIDVCRAWDVDKSTMSGLVTRMVRDGHITCERDWLDRRRTILRMTEKGQESWMHMEQKLQELEARAWTGISDAEKAQFMETIRKVCHNLDDEKEQENE